MLWIQRGYRWCARLLGRVLIALVRFYQLFISPLKPPSCRFYPTCSSYMIEAIQVHGPLKGFWLGIKRLGKCHPLHPGGVDLVPPHSTCRDSACAHHEATSVTSASQEETPESTRRASNGKDAL